jgi:hypothetical protein
MVAILLASLFRLFACPRSIAMIYSTFASDLFPAVGSVAENAVLWLGAALMISHLCALCIAAGGMAKIWRPRALVN